MKRLLLILTAITVGCTDRVIDIIHFSKDKVVKVGIIAGDRQGVGSGAFIDGDGTVLTCAHVVLHPNTSKIFIKTEDEQVYDAKIIKIDKSRDLATLRPIGLNHRVRFFRFGHNVRIGEEVVSFGSPLGFQHTVTDGRVTNIVTQEYKFIFHSAFINPGNSGGPLVNIMGNLVGINEATLSLNPFQSAQGLYVAIDLDTIREFLGKK